MRKEIFRQKREHFSKLADMQLHVERMLKLVEEKLKNVKEVSNRNKFQEQYEAAVRRRNQEKKAFAINHFESLLGNLIKKNVKTIAFKNMLSVDKPIFEP